MSEIANLPIRNREEQNRRFLEEFHRRFGGADDGPLTHCPNHDDGNPTCEIRNGETPGTLHLHCHHPQCSNRAVRDAAIALGVQPEHLDVRGIANKTADIVMPVPSSFATDLPYNTGDRCTANIKIGTDAGGDPIYHRYPAIATVTKYEDGNGDLNYIVVRMDYEDEDGNKRKLPRTMVLAETDEGRKWVWGWPDPAVKRTALNLRFLLSVDPDVWPVGIVEGEKTWAAVTDRNHPWAENLGQFAWTTFSGGADNAGLTDWGWVRGRDVYLFPDNDEASRIGFYRLAVLLVNCGARSVYILDFGLFDYEPPHKWDLADPIWRRKPKRKHKANKSEAPLVNWVEFSDALVPFDRPFREYWVEGELAHEIRDEFVEQWVYIRADDKLVYRPRPTIRFTRPQFNNSMRQEYAPTDVWGHLMGHPKLEHADRVGYRPGEKTGKRFVNRADGAVCINSYRPTQVVPHQASIRPFLLFMRHLVPNRRDRKILIRKLAMQIGLPQERKLTWAVLLVSEQTGVGKTMLMQLVAHLVGVHNMHKLDPDRLHNDNFNAWAATSYLVLIEELREGSSFKTPEKLKDIITNDYGPVRRMYNDEATNEYHSWFMASSNHLSSAALNVHDRRWFAPGVTEQQGVTEPGLLAMADGRSPYEAFHHWAYFDGGDAALLFYAEQYADAHVHEIGTKIGTDRGLSHNAPWTETKGRLIEHSKPDWFRDLMDVLYNLPDGAVVTLECIRNYLKLRLDDPKYKRDTLVRLLDEEGWVRPWPKHSGIARKPEMGKIKFTDANGKQKERTVLSRSMYWYNSKPNEVPENFGTADQLRANTWWLVNYHAGNDQTKLFADGRWYEDEQPTRDE
ncbi:hypothetical protein GS634_07820 [Ruegeria atlantica]|uniref:NrS-1 polymerase-like helicase domain-containing protein n=1 Tax=Ruegeria atlantica TaxID=81569 RepID=A0AA90YSE6_9RHOB|nr:primase-helicase family protein [Ruegeria atlantica]NOE18031.1 hypothetical protein [Ruegeria atlantica]